MLSWPALAEAIAERAAQAVADLQHPWTVRWPTGPEMAVEFGTSRKTVSLALNHLGKEGVLARAWVDRTSGPQQVWVPRERALGSTPKPSIDQMAAEMLRRGLQGEWAMLPPMDQMGAHFGVTRQTIIKVVKLLAERHHAVKLRVGGHYRWFIMPPYQRRTVDPRQTATAPQVVITDLIRRILAGEFRYRLPPDPTIHERPFLANREIAAQYQAAAPTVTKVRRELVDLGWIVPGERSNTHYRLASRVPPIDRTTHPAPMTPRKKPTPPPRNRRAGDISADLIRRIRNGEFRYAFNPFPTQEQLRAEYRAATENVQAALQVLERDGWIEFRPIVPRGRAAVLLPQFRQRRARQLEHGGAQAPTATTNG